MKESIRRHEKRPRIIPVPKREVVFSTDRVKTKESANENRFEKKDLFAR